MIKNFRLCFHFGSWCNLSNTMNCTLLHHELLFKFFCVQFAFLTLHKIWFLSHFLRKPKEPSGLIIWVAIYTDCWVQPCPYVSPTLHGCTVVPGISEVFYLRTNHQYSLWTQNWSMKRQSHAKEEYCAWFIPYNTISRSTYHVYITNLGFRVNPQQIFLQLRQLIWST